MTYMTEFLHLKTSNECSCNGGIRKPLLIDPNKSLDKVLRLFNQSFAKHHELFHVCCVHQKACGLCDSYRDTF